MNFKSFTTKMFCCAVLAASVSTANAAIEDVDRLMIVGGSVWCGYSIDNSIPLISEENSKQFKATVYISNEGDGFKFLTHDDWGGGALPGEQRHCHEVWCRV